MVQLGKPNRAFMAEVISRFGGARSSKVILGSRPGVDVSVLQVDSRRVMIVSCDPISYIPSIGPKRSARMSAYEVASDVATSGVPPRYAVVDLNLPPQMSDRALAEYWKSFHEACLELGLSIVGGHTGRFEGCDYSVVGGATLWAFCKKSEYVTSRMAGEGDDLVMTKSAAYGATAVLATAFPRRVEGILGPSMYENARKYFIRSNTVEDSIVAAGVGLHERGVTAMHDATEGGIIAALFEISEASGLGGIISLDDIPISEETIHLCKSFGIDPLVSLGEGSLVIACRPSRTGAIIARLRSKGISAATVGRLTTKVLGLHGTTKNGRVALRYPAVDPYWKAYWKAVRRGWS